MEQVVSRFAVEFVYNQGFPPEEQGLTSFTWVLIRKHLVPLKIHIFNSLNLFLNTEVGFPLFVPENGESTLRDMYPYYRSKFSTP